MTDYLSLTFDQVLLALIFSAGAIALLWYNRSGLERQYLLGVVRSFVQLWVMGYVLVWLFQFETMWVQLLVVQLMILVAAYTAGRRQESFSLPTVLILLLALELTLLIVATVLYVLVLRVYPWQNPHLFIPLMGMVIGNSANTAALLVHRMKGEVHSHRGPIEAALALGAAPRYAVQPYVAQSLRNALIPQINTMMMIGLVQIPGIMTGQIMAGISPEQAMKYQLIVLFMLSSASVLTCHFTVQLELRRLFTPQWGLTDGD